MKKTLFLLTIVTCLLLTGCRFPRHRQPLGGNPTTFPVVTTQSKSRVPVFTNLFTNGKIYTEEDVRIKCGADSVSVKEREIAGITAKSVRLSKSTTDEHFDYMDFIIYDSEADAKKAFENTESWFWDIEEEGSDYRKGWLAGVCDASIEEYVYLSGNMIITVETACYSEWAEEVPDEDEIVEVHEMTPEEEHAIKVWTPEYRQEVIDLMRSTF